MSQTRRHFLKTAAVTLLIPALAQAEQKRGKKPSAGGDADLPLVEPGKGMAQSLNYVNSHNDVKDAALKIDRGGLPFAKQFCNNCMLYAAAGKKGADAVGKCTLFAGQVVKSNAWCASWSKKA
jgi:hypothetical protein